MKRSMWGTLNAVVLMGLLMVALAVWMPTRIGASKPAPSPAPPMAWEPITLSMAVLLADYTDREDWTACETKGVSPLYVRCPDGYTMEIH